MAEYTDRDTLCVVMEHIDGTSLQSLAGQQAPDVPDVAGGGAAAFPEAMLLSYAEADPALRTKMRRSAAPRM